MKLRKGDQVKMISGKDRGKTGKVLNVFPAKGEARSGRPKDERISVEGLNVYKKRVRPKRQGQKGETVLVPRPFNAAKAMLVCGSCKKAVRVGHRFEGDRKVRYCKKCGVET